jgi:hypothetical protein
VYRLNRRGATQARGGRREARWGRDAGQERKGAVPGPHARRFWVSPAALVGLLPSATEGLGKTPPAADAAPRGNAFSRGILPEGLAGPPSRHAKDGSIVPPAARLSHGPLVQGRRERRPKAPLKTVDNVPSPAFGIQHIGSAAGDVKRSVTLKNAHQKSAEKNYTKPMKRPQITTMSQNAMEMAP